VVAAVLARLGPDTIGADPAFPSPGAAGLDGVPSRGRQPGSA
jgi:hypothetical protein